MIGQVWATKKSTYLIGQKLLLIAMKDINNNYTGELVVATDTLQSSEGENVMISFGSGARNVLAQGKNNKTFLTDAAVSMIIEE